MAYQPDPRSQLACPHCPEVHEGTPLKKKVCFLSLLVFFVVVILLFILFVCESV